MNEQQSFKGKVVKGLKWFFFSYIWLAILFFAIDLITKQVIVHYFVKDGALVNDPPVPIVLIPGFLQINYTINQSAAFGFGLGNPTTQRVLYCIIAFIGLGLIVGIYSVKFKKLSSFVKACLMLMSVGAIGNLVDRIFYSGTFLGKGYNGVVDWIDFCGIWQFIFNIADSCIVVGTIMLIIWLIVSEVKESKKRKQLEAPQEKGEKVLSKEEQMRLEKVQEQKEEETVKE